MARIIQEQWDEAKAMFEAGASLSEIAARVDIERSTISKGAVLDNYPSSSLTH